MPADQQLKEKESRRSHLHFSFNGNFIHESRCHTASKNINEFLLNEPECVQFEITCNDTGETFHCVGTLLLDRVNEHIYQCPDSEAEEWASKDAAYNQNVFAHVGPPKTKMMRGAVEIPRHDSARKRKVRIDRQAEFIN
tara:strand:+ start:776 stop:1192 length:417 start_codon:yes stop_codon:yes gene_type:complete